MFNNTEVDADFYTKNSQWALWIDEIAASSSENPHAIQEKPMQPQNCSGLLLLRSEFGDMWF